MRFVAEFCIQRINQRISINEDHIVATLLDPRFKKSNQVSKILDEAHTTANAILKEYINKVQVVTEGSCKFSF